MNTDDTPRYGVIVDGATVSLSHAELTTIVRALQFAANETDWQQRDKFFPVCAYDNSYWPLMKLSQDIGNRLPM